MIDNSEALNLLTSASRDERLRAARYLSKFANAENLDVITRAYASETVPWIKSALTQALERIGSGAIDNQLNSGSSEGDSLRVVRDAKAEAIEEVAGTIIHEFTAQIGAIRLAAQAEVPDYPNSRVYRTLERLNSTVKAVRRLKKTSALPNYSSFDLSSLVLEKVEEVVSPEVVAINILYGGTKPFIVSADRETMGIAIVNGLKNAIEAVLDHSRRDPPEIVINWGHAGDRSYLVILDSGPGFKGDPVHALKLGYTNKKDHIGYGLATSQYAMTNMEGELLLSNNPEGGARFELRWYRENENITGGG